MKLAAENKKCLNKLRYYRGSCVADALRVREFYTPYCSHRSLRHVTKPRSFSRQNLGD